MLKIELYETLLVNNGVAFFRDIVEMAVNLKIASGLLGRSMSRRHELIDENTVKSVVIPELNKKYGLHKNSRLVYLGPRGKYLLKYYNVDSFYKIKYLMDKAVKISKALYERNKRPYPTPIPREKIWIFGRPTKEEVISIFGEEIL